MSCLKMQTPQMPHCVNRCQRDELTTCIKVTGLFDVNSRAVPGQYLPMKKGNAVLASLVHRPRLARRVEAQSSCISLRWTASHLCERRPGSRG